MYHVSAKLLLREVAGSGTSLTNIAVQAREVFVSVSLLISITSRFPEPSLLDVLCLWEGFCSVP